MILSLKILKIKNFLIILGVSIPAIQALFFIYNFGVNIPLADEWVTVRYFNSFFSGDDTWIFQIFTQHNEHRIFFPNLVFLSNATITSWNVVTQMYLGWIFIGISLFPIFFFLKKVGTNFEWLLIPASILMYSPMQTSNLLWGFQIQWFFLLAFFLWSLYFLTTKKHLHFLLSIIFAILASFSFLLGLLIWPIGLLSLIFIFKFRKIYLITWVVAAIIIFNIYFYDFQQNPQHPIDLSISNANNYFGYVFTYLGSAFLMPSIPIKVVIGIIISIIIISSLIVIIKKKKFNPTILPWIQLSLFTVFAALITGVGRLSFGIEQASAPKYITISNMLDISSLVFLCIIFVILRENFKSKKQKTFLALGFLTIIIIGSISISNSYVQGWKMGENNLNYLSAKLACFSIPTMDHLCEGLFHKMNVLHDHSNVLLTYNLGPYSYLDSNFIRGSEPLFEKENWEKLQEKKGFGTIDYVNDNNLQDGNKIYIVESTVNISGWFLDENKKSVDNIYLVIDDIPFLRLGTYPRIPGFDTPTTQEDSFKDAMKFLWKQRIDLREAFPEVEKNDFSKFEKWALNQEWQPIENYIEENFKPRPDIVAKMGHEADLKSGWNVKFLSGYLSEGCHNISIASVKNITKFVIEQELELCKNN